MTPNPCRILIVDDDKDSLVNLSDILTEIGYAVAIAENGTDAIEIVNNQCSSGECRFDLCLLDFKMPDMDGVELLKAIQTIDPAICAIMITAFAGSDGIQRAVKAGTWDILKKPVDIDRLLQMIDEMAA